MRRDELRKPLRQRGRGERLWAKRPSPLVLTSVALVAAFVGGATWAIRTPMPFAGEPIVVAAIPALEELKTASVTPPEEAVPEEAPEAPEATVEVVEPVAQDTYRKDAAIIVSPRQALKPAPVSAITEVSAAGDLPKIGSGGRRAAEVYARITPMGVLHSDAPKIAILLGGMGLNSRLTQKAIKDLPGDISMAFAPYGNDLQSQVNLARANGHEVLLQVPMEPWATPPIIQVPRPWWLRPMPPSIRKASIGT
jgi:uncharacterized protein